MIYTGSMAQTSNRWEAQARQAKVARMVPQVLLTAQARKVTAAEVALSASTRRMLEANTPGLPAASDTTWGLVWAKVVATLELCEQIAAARTVADLMASVA